MKYQEMKAIVDFLKTTEGQNTPEWQKAINDLQTLMDEMKPYEDPEEEGNFPPITQENYRRIEIAFDNAVTSTNEFIKSSEGSNEINDTVRTQLSKNLNKEFLSKAYIEFKNISPNPSKSLHESMEEFRYENVVLSNEDLKRVGANMSSRIQMNIDLDGRSVKGVFTKHTTYNPEKQYADIISEMKLKYGAFNSFWDSMNNPQFFREGALSIDSNLFMNSATNVVYDTDPEAKETALDNTKQLAAMDGFPRINAEFERFKNDPSFYGALFDFSLKMEQLASSVGVNEEILGIQQGDVIDVRNSAMSSVANLLDVNDLIAKSKSISVKMPDGTHQSGTFMEFVESKDITNLDSIDEMRVYGLDAYDSKEVKTQLANLQVLDYICGNADRHVGNMLYRFDPKTHKLTNIKGIDNDASFCKDMLDKKDSLGQLPPLNKMRVIDQAMADKLLTIDEGMLGATLHGYGLSEQEIKASWDRLHNLQEAIREAKVFDPEKGLEPFDRESGKNGLTIVKSEDWDKLNLQQISLDNNYFAKIVNAQQIITTQNMVTHKMKMNAECSKRAAKSMLNKDNTKDLLARAKSHKPFMGTSQRYTNVLTAFQNYQNLPVPEDPLNPEAQAKWESAAALKRAVDAYNQEKINIGHFNPDGTPARQFSGNALHRIEDVAEIGKFVNKLLETKKVAEDNQRAVDVATRKQQELDEFKSKSPVEQQAILDRKHAEEAEKNQDLSVRIQNSLAKDENLFDLDSESFDEDLSMDAAEVEVQQEDLSNKLIK